jgi:transcription initiation factor TFIID TATA-box-binding protein
MDGADFIGLSEELNEKTLSEYQALANSTEPGADAELADGAQGCPLVPRIVNIVARVHYGSDLDLLKIATHARNAEYNPKRFPAVTLRIHDPKATGLTFKTGVMNIVGCRTVESAHLAARKFGRILKNLGFPVRMKLFEIVNIVATMDCRFPIHLESLAGSPHKVFTQYNPEIFAGLIYRIMKKPECTFLVFVSGKIVVTGAKSLDIITSAANYIYPILQQFARNVIPEPEAV